MTLSLRYKQRSCSAKGYGTGSPASIDATCGIQVSELSPTLRYM